MSGTARPATDTSRRSSCLTRLLVGFEGMMLPLFHDAILRIVILPN